MNHKIFRVPGYVEEHIEDAQKAIAIAVERTQSQDAAAHPPYSGPSTPEEWWALVDEWWAELAAICERFVRLDKPVEEDGMFLGVSGHVHMAQLKQRRNPKLAGYFDAAWCNAPDNGMIHSLHGWGVLCDLCSEQCVFEEQAPE